MKTFPTKPILLLLIIAAGLAIFSCKKDSELSDDDDSMEPEDCFYLFEAGSDAIYGSWEPAVIIDKESGDSTFYEPGEAKGGYLFGGYYADAFELRDIAEIAIYYIESGRPCKSDANGEWEYENRVLTVKLLTDTLALPVLLLEENQLVIEDEIDFKESIAIMRKAAP